MRKRDGGKGQQHLLAPLTPEFDRGKIAEMLDPNLPDGILVENTATLREIGLLTVKIKAPETPSGKQQIVYEPA